MQGPANSGGFTHDGESYSADENDVIEVPGEIVEHAKHHGFSLLAEKAGKAAPRPLAKASGVKDEDTGEDEKDVKAAQKGAKASGVKGGAE
jgi:hypothetical protein